MKGVSASEMEQFTQKDEGEKGKVQPEMRCKLSNIANDRRVSRIIADQSHYTDSCKFGILTYLTFVNLSSETSLVM